MKVNTKVYFFSIVFASLLLTGCATGYHPKNFSGGFKEYQLNADTYTIVFSGNEYTSSGTAYEYALRRAAELTIGKGFKYFIIKKSVSDVSRRSYTRPIESKTTTNYHTHAFNNDETVNSESNTTITGGDTYIQEKPTTGMIIQMLRYNDPGALDAAIILSNYTTKSSK